MMANLTKSFSFQLKRPKICNFFGLKAVLRKNYDYKPQFFLEILKAVCLSVDWVPKLIQIFFPTMEQKLVQRCGTEIVADACSASYIDTHCDSMTASAQRAEALKTPYK